MDFIEDSLRRLRHDHPDLAYLLMMMLKDIGDIKEHLAKKPPPAPRRIDLSKLTQPQTMLFFGGGIALLAQFPLPVIVEFLKAVAPLFSQ